MSKGPYPFKLTDLRRAVKAITGAGLPVFQVRIKLDGKTSEIIVDTLPSEPDVPTEEKAIVL